MGILSENRCFKISKPFQLNESIYQSSDMDAVAIYENIANMVYDDFAMFEMYITTEIANDALNHKISNNEILSENLQVVTENAFTNLINKFIGWIKNAIEAIKTAFSKFIGLFKKKSVDTKKNFEAKKASVDVSKCGAMKFIWYPTRSKAGSIEDRFSYDKDFKFDNIACYRSIKNVLDEIIGKYKADGFGANYSGYNSKLDDIRRDFSNDKFDNDLYRHYLGTWVPKDVYDKQECKDAVQRYFFLEDQEVTGFTSEHYKACEEALNGALSKFADKLSKEADELKATFTNLHSEFETLKNEVIDKAGENASDNANLVRDAVVKMNALVSHTEGIIANSLVPGQIDAVQRYVNHCESIWNKAAELSK